MRSAPLVAVLMAAALAVSVVPWGGSGASAQPRTKQAFANDPRLWRAFRPLVLAAGGGDAERAVSYLRRSSALLRKADAALDVDAPTTEFRSRARESLERFDFEGFYRLLPQRVGRYRRVAVRGMEVGPRYALRQAHGDAFEVHAGGERTTFGDSSVVVRARPLEEGETERYLVQWRGGVGVGALDWQNVLVGASDALQLLELEPEQDVPMAMAAADSYLRKSQTSLGPEDRRVLAAQWASFVKVAEFLTALGVSEDVRAPLRVEGCVPVQLVSRWSVERIARQYPEAADYLEGLGDLMEAHLHVTDAAGFTLLKAHTETARLRTTLRAFVKDGRLVPSKGGKPMPARTARYERMRARLDLHFVLHGIHVFVDDLRVDLTYREAAEGALLEASATRTPRVRVKGAALGLFPAGMLDWFIPGDIPTLATGLFEAAVKGNEGRGLALYARFHRHGSGESTVNGSAGWEVLDNALVRFGMGIVSERVLPDDSQQQSLERMALAYRDAFDADVLRFARFGRKPPAP